MVELPPHEGRTEELRGGCSCQGACLPLTDALPLPRPCIIIEVNNAGILCTRENLYLQKFIPANLKGRYREIFLHILVDIGPQKSTLKVYFPKPLFPRDMGCLKSIF